MGAKWVNNAIERGPKYFIPPVTDTGAQERVENYSLYSIAAAGNGKLHKSIYTSRKCYLLYNLSSYMSTGTICTAGKEIHELLNQQISFSKLFHVTVCITTHSFFLTVRLGAESAKLFFRSPFPQPPEPTVG